MSALAAVHIAIRLTIPLSGEAPTADINIGGIIQTPMLNSGPVKGLNIEGFIFLPNRRGVSAYPHTLKHESTHTNHWRALGPVFPLAYAATGGKAFEDYQEYGGKYNESTPWVPAEGQQWNCPTMRVSQAGVQLLPCWTAIGTP